MDSDQKRAKDEQDVDRISNLPSEILCHILSFLSSKSALKTSVLSKQWKELWTHVPVLSFNEMPSSYFDVDERTPQKITHFKNFVHKVLAQNVASCVRLLSLDLGVLPWDDILRDNFGYINSWLDTIAKRDIHEIFIEYLLSDGQPQVVLPTNFLSRERLVVLTLDGGFSIDDRSLTHLPNIEVIRFIDLEFPNDEFLKRLLSGCLVLRDLTIGFCTGMSKSVFVESLSLRRLHILGVARLTVQTSIVIETPNLRDLVLEDTLKQNFTGHMSSLEVACLHLEYESADYALQVVQSVSGVTKLVSANSLFRYISKPPIFQNLTHLELDNAEKLCTILGCAPKLKYLIFELEAYADISLDSEVVPACLSRLEVVHFSRFRAEEEEFELAAYLLKFASMLKEMKINTMSSNIENDYERLTRLPRSSSSCQFIVT